MERILLVEDEPSNRAVLSAYLMQAGYLVDEVEDGIAAWSMLTTIPDYAVVVTDRYMPRMDGLKLFRHMQAFSCLRQIPVIMQTAAATSEEIIEGIQAGLHYYLTKPYQEEMLLAIVRTAIRERYKNGMFESRLFQQREIFCNAVRAEFEIRIPEEAKNVACLIGSLFPRPVAAVTGLYELLLNAIEHGNLGIGFEGKAKLLAQSDWEIDLQQRLKLPRNTEKKVSIQLIQDKAGVEVMIVDEGKGFDWKPYLKIEPSRAILANGRGIAKANLLSFGELSYYGSGNQVRVAARHNAA